MKRFMFWGRVLTLVISAALLPFGAFALSGSGDSAVGALETVSPTLESVAPVTERSVSATFSETMLAPGVITPDNYAVSDVGAGTLNATPDVVAGTGPYTLGWVAGEMKNNANLTVTASGLQDAVGNPIDPAGNSASCAGLGIGPMFALLPSPAQAEAGQTVTLTLRVSKPLDDNPIVVVNGREATYVSGGGGADYVFEYVVQEDDPLGGALVSITGFDLAGNMGAFETFEVVNTVPEPQVPLRAWPMILVLLAAGIAAMAWRRYRAAAFLLLVVVAQASLPAFADAPTVSNVTFSQGPNGLSTQVDIYYDLVAPNGPCEITVSLSKDGGVDEFEYSVTSVTGDLTGVTTGTGHHIVWDIRADYPEEDIPNAQIRITAEDGLVMLPGDVPLELVYIPAGTFMMGRYPGEQNSLAREDPQHSVTLSQGFWMGKYEITQQQWLAVMGSWPGTAPSSDYGLGDSYPAYYVSWGDAQNFITALNTHITDTSQGPATVRLPSEAEWEYACRAGTTTRFYFGDSLGCAADCSDCAAGVLPGNRSDYMWYCGNNDPYGSKPVGGKLPNAFGLYDMSGNVWEWCQDWYGTYPSGSVTDPTGPTSGSDRIFRGGSWINSGIFSRSAYRYYDDPTIASYSLGFRLAR